MDRVRTHQVSLGLGGPSVKPVGDPTDVRVGDHVGHRFEEFAPHCEVRLKVGRADNAVDDLADSLSTAGRNDSVGDYGHRVLLAAGKEVVGRQVPLPQCGGLGGE